MSNLECVKCGRLIRDSAAGCQNPKCKEPDQNPGLERPVNREWSSRYHFQGMSPRELESERLRALRKTKGRGSAKWVLFTILVSGVVGSALAVGYFLSVSQTEETLDSKVPSDPVNPSGRNSESPSPNGGAQLIPVATPASAATTTSSPTPLKPTPTLTLNELFQLNDSGELSNEETIRELERRSTDTTNLSSTEVPPIAVDPIPTLLNNARGSREWIIALEFEIRQLVNVERKQNSLSILSQDPALDEMARGHSEDMALNNYFEHENLAGQDATDRGNLLGYRCLKDFGSFYTLGISENIFQGWLYSSFNSRSRNYMTLEELASHVVGKWMDSPGHRKNILTGTFDREGIGVRIGADESVWVTQNFC